MKAKIITFLFLMLLLPSASVNSQETRRLFEQGMESFRKGNFGSAELLFRKTLDQNSDDYRDRAWFYIARSMHARKNYRSALFEFNSFLNRCTNESLAAESRYWMGECHYHLGEYHKAIEEYRRYILKEPKGTLASRAHERIGDIYYDQKRNDEAVLEWDAAIAGEREVIRNRSLRYRAAYALYESGRYDEALRRLPEAEVTCNDREEARMLVLSGLIYQKLNDDTKAVRAFKAIPVDMMKDTILRDARFYEALSHIKLGEKTAAEDLLRVYLRHGKDTRHYNEARCELGALLIAGDRNAEGIELLEGVRSSATERATISHAVKLLGLYYLERQPARAITYLEESLAGVPQEHRSVMLLALGRAYMLSGRINDAIEKFKTILNEGPFAQERDDAGFLIGIAYLEKGDFEQSIEAFEAIRKDQPFSRHYAESRYYLALARSKKGDLDAAISLLNDHLREKSPAREYEATLLLFRVLMQKGDLTRAGRTAELLMRNHTQGKGLDGALLEFAAALLRTGIPSKRHIDALSLRFKDTENGAELSMIIANDHFGNRRYTDALEHYNAYLSTPYTAHRIAALLGKARCLYQLGRYEDVSAITMASDLPYMHLKDLDEVNILRVRSLYHLKRYKDAYGSFNATRLEDYAIADVRIFLECAMRVGDRPSVTKALHILHSDRELFSESLYTLGRYYMEREDLAEAERYFQRVVDECPGSGHEGHAVLSLGELRLIRGDPRGALAVIAAVELQGGGEVTTMKTALMIRCYFSLGMTKEAITLTEKERVGLLQCPCGESVMKNALDHYFRKKDLHQFNRYATFLARYKGNEEYIEYLSGKLNFQAGNYEVAYKHFKVLSGNGSWYRDEALYYMGLHEILVLGNAEIAGKTFSALLADSDTAGVTRLKALLNMAIIFRERGDHTKARDCLMTIIRIEKRGNVYTQAKNLIEEFGYKEP